ncbi:hypothetical protein ABH521_006755 [Staphylococcus warneri]|uniref:hypothetical protein n=1 Tax=Staphylococcus warneri TaxID=1292 RepID=UPI00325FFAEE
MKQTEYQIKSKKMSNDSEETSSISQISYEIENANDHGLRINKINRQINDLKKYDKFPENLDYVDSYTDPNTGTTATAFLNNDTGKVTIGMTGTNVHDKALNKVSKNLRNPLINSASAQDYKDSVNTIKDVGADLNIGKETVTDKDIHFKSTQKFINSIKKDYDIDTITGHSLGGRDAIILGIGNDIDNVVAYNPAPISVKDFRYVLNDINTMPEYIEKDKYIENMIKKYDGNILRVVSDKDELNKFVKKHEYVSAGNEMIIKNGKGHSMIGFLGKNEQKEIKDNLKSLEGYKDANRKTYKSVKKMTENKFGNIDNVRTNMMQANGGTLSSSQEKLLQFLIASSIAEGLGQIIDEEIQRLEKMYQKMGKKFDGNWENAQESASEVGKKLSMEEVLSALETGNVNENRLVTEPHQKITNRITQLTQVSTQYTAYIRKIGKSIEKIVDKDQALAGQISGVM